MPKQKSVIRLGLDVGGTNLRLGVFEDMALLEECRFQADYGLLCKKNTPELAWKAILEVTADAIRNMQEKYPAIESIGIGFPGFIDPHSGILAQSPNLPGLLNVNLGADLSSLLNLKVRTDNDANVAAFGEYHLHSQPEGGLLYLGLGTGVGAGLVVNGRIWTGQHGYALEAGHIIIEPDGRLCGCGNRGCVEQYASATGISHAYAELAGDTFTAHEIALLAQQENQHALHVYHQAGEKLAQMLASVLKVLDVCTVVIGGGVTAAWPFMQAAFHQRLEHDLIPVMRGKVQIHISDSGDQAGILGAALLSS